MFIESRSFNKPWSQAQIKCEIQSDMECENWVYLMEELVVGYIFCWRILNEFHLNNIAVHPNYLRKSIGKKLIQHIISRVISSDIEVVKNNLNKWNSDVLVFVKPKMVWDKKEKKWVRKERDDYSRWLFRSTPPEFGRLFIKSDLEVEIDKNIFGDTKYFKKLYEDEYYVVLRNI